MVCKVEIVSAKFAVKPLRTTLYNLRWNGTAKDGEYVLNKSRSARLEFSSRKAAQRGHDKLCECNDNS
jgi:hypothetical protein